MKNFPRQKLFLFLICGAALFGATIFLSGHFDPYQALIAEFMGDFFTPQARLVLSEAYSLIELFAGAFSLNDHPAFQGFDVSHMMWILMMGSFLGMVLLWHRFEEDWFDTSGRQMLDRGIIWITHYFAT